jgi:hypothetical protein
LSEATLPLRRARAGEARRSHPRHAPGVLSPLSGCQSVMSEDEPERERSSEDDLSHGEPPGARAGTGMSVRALESVGDAARGVYWSWLAHAMGAPCHGPLTRHHQPSGQCVELVRMGVENPAAPPRAEPAAPPRGPGPPRLPLRGATAGAPRFPVGGLYCAGDEGGAVSGALRSPPGHTSDTGGLLLPAVSVPHRHRSRSPSAGVESGSLRRPAWLSPEEPDPQWVPAPRPMP